VARRGESSAEGVRVLCRAHNQYEAERIVGRETVLAGRAAREVDDDLVAGLRRVGVTAGDARRAVAASPRGGAVEQRLGAALGALRSIDPSRASGTRCEEARPRWLGRAARTRTDRTGVYRSTRAGT